MGGALLQLLPALPRLPNSRDVLPALLLTLLQLPSSPLNMVKVQGSSDRWLLPQRKSRLYFSECPPPPPQRIENNLLIMTAVVLPLGPPLATPSVECSGADPANLQHSSSPIPHSLLRTGSTRVQLGATVLRAVMPMPKASPNAWTSTRGTCRSAVGIWNNWYVITAAMFYLLDGS